MLFSVLKVKQNKYDLFPMASKAIQFSSAYHYVSNFTITPS